MNKLLRPLIEESSLGIKTLFGSAVPIITPSMELISSGLIFITPFPSVMPFTDSRELNLPESGEDIPIDVELISTEIDIIGIPPVPGYFSRFDP